MTEVATGRASGFPPTRPQPRPDLLTAGSPARQLLAEPSMAIYGLPGFILPLMHPATAAATLERDPVFAPGSDVIDLARRLRDTLEMISGVAHADSESDHVAYAMRELHRPITGDDTRGKHYHAWTRHIWTWNWAAIVAGYMYNYGQLRGWPSAEFRDDCYLGMIEVGRRFGVLGMPASYTEFMDMWPAERDRVADPGNAGVQMLVNLVYADGMPAPRPFRTVPGPVWALLTAPVRHFLRMSLMVGLTSEERRMIGFKERPRDHTWARIHIAFWRKLPRQLTYRLGLLWIGVRAKRGEPVWRTRFSASALEARNQITSKDS